MGSLRPRGCGQHSEEASRMEGNPWASEKKIDSSQLFSGGPRGASDHKKDCRNEKFRRFAIGADFVPRTLFFLSQPLYEL